MDIQSECTFFKPRCSYSNSYSPTSFPSPAIPLTPHVSLVPGLLSPVVGVWEGAGDEATLIVTPEGNDVTCSICLDTKPLLCALSALWCFRLTMHAGASRWRHVLLSMINSCLGSKARFVVYRASPSLNLKTLLRWSGSTGFAMHEYMIFKAS